MSADPVNTALAIGTVPLLLFAGIVTVVVLRKCIPDIKKHWKETKE